MAGQALEGVNVLEIAFIGVTPMTCKLLADHGAEVVRIESSTRLDYLRTSGPYIDGIVSPEHSPQVPYLHSNKYGITLNLKNPKGVEIARKLVARADIVADGFTTGTLERMGLGYEELRKIKPDIIMFSCNTFGRTSPLSSFPSTGIQITGITGFSQITGWPDRGASAIGYYTDFTVPHFNLTTVLAALDYRRRTGKGQLLDLSHIETSIHFMAPVVMDYAVNNRLMQRQGNRSPSAAPHGVYRCQGDDRWCAIVVSTDEEWQSFGKVIGNPALSTNPKFSTLPARKENEEELDSLVEEWTINHSPEEVMTMMQAAGVAAGVVETGEDLLEHDTQLRHRHFFWELDHPEIGKHRARGPAFVLSKCPCEVQRAPLLGEHNEYAFKEILGMSDEEVAELVIEGVIE